MLDAPERTAARSACAAKRKGTRRAPQPFEKTKDRQGGLRFLRRESEARSQGVYRQPAGASAGARREIDAPFFRDSSDEGCADIDRNDLVSLASLQSENPPTVAVLLR